MKNIFFIIKHTYICIENYKEPKQKSQLRFKKRSKKQELRFLRK